jgi:hypothetical protein
MLHDYIPCEEIGSKEYGHGTLYGLVLSSATKHRTLDNQITRLDNFLMQSGGGGTSTRFTSVSPILGGKIKTFGSGEHMLDEHYKTLFKSLPGRGKKLEMHNDVDKWKPPPAEGVRVPTAAHEEAVNPEGEASDEKDLGQKLASAGDGGLSKLTNALAEIEGVCAKTSTTTEIQRPIQQEDREHSADEGTQKRALDGESSSACQHRVLCYLNGVCEWTAHGFKTVCNFRRVFARS